MQTRRSKKVSQPIEVDKKCNKGNRFLDKDYSFKVFDDVKKAAKRNSSNHLDVYEFICDPNEEPPPQKKKRKRVVRKKPEKAKPAFAYNYDKNVAKSLAALKKVLSSKTSQSKPHESETTIQNREANNNLNTKRNNLTPQLNSAQEIASAKIFNSFHVEDIVLNHDHSDINYSPINSPNHVRLPSEPRHNNNDVDNIKEIAKNKDPLNLQDNISFFDETPAASSSMIVSTRNPSATPWRVEFEKLPIKWHVNTYIKPNMTPAVETSFINFGDEKNKHVYTNIVPEENESLPEIVESDNTPRLKQTSIISFIKEVVEKSDRKKSKAKSTPVKENSIFADISNNSICAAITPIKKNASNLINNSVTPIKKKPSDNITSSNDSVSITNKENSTETVREIKKNKKKNDNITFFGFDEIEEHDQENISPNKKVNKRHIRALRPRRAILQELNAQGSPTRNHNAIISDPIANENDDSMINKMKTPTNVQVNSEKTIENNSETTNNANNAIIANSANLSDEDSQSVHLFEDLDIIHHMKPPRKSYGKAKKVTFRQNSVSSDTQESDVVPQQNGSSEEEDNLDDLTYQMPSTQPKKSQRKKKAKNKLSKKEEKEADAWAAGFNSMCNDVDQFDLVVE